MLVVGMVAAPAAAQYDETEEQEEPEPEEAEQEEEPEQEPQERNEEENATSLTVPESEARDIAASTLSDRNWTLEDISTEEEEAYYELEYAVENTESEAEVRIDGSSGDVLRREEDIERETEPEEPQVDPASVQASSLEQARERIQELRETVTELRRENARLRSAQSGQVPDAAEAENPEREIESRRGPNGTEVETEVDGNNVEVEAEGQVNGTEVEIEAEGELEGSPFERNQTPGSDTARENRPGFVSQVLGGIFG